MYTTTLWVHLYEQEEQDGGLSHGTSGVQKQA